MPHQLPIEAVIYTLLFNKNIPKAVCIANGIRWFPVPKEAHNLKKEARHYHTQKKISEKEPLLRCTGTTAFSPLLSINKNHHLEMCFCPIKIIGALSNGNVLFKNKGNNDSAHGGHAPLQCVPVWCFFCSP